MFSRIFEMSGYLIGMSLFMFFNLYLATQISYTRVDLTLETEQQDHFQIFWRKDHEPYEEKKSILIKTHPARTTYSFKIASLAQFKWLRVDPVRIEQAVRIRKLYLKHNLYRPLSVFPQETQVNLLNTHQLGAVQQNREEGLYIVPEGTDPFFELNIESSMNKTIFYSFIVITFAGTVILYILLNQTLLKGTRRAATVLLIVPKSDKSTSKTDLLQIVRKYCPQKSLKSVHIQPESEKYVFNFPIMRNRSLTAFLKEVKTLSPLIQYRIQYNRSGEV